MVCICPTGGLPALQVGLNNIKDTDFVNVVIQSLMRVTPLRDFFLLTDNYTPRGAAASVARAPSVLLQRFGELTRKVWHARNFKGQVRGNGQRSCMTVCCVLPSMHAFMMACRTS